MEEKGDGIEHAVRECSGTYDDGEETQTEKWRSVPTRHSLRGYIDQHRGEGGGGGTPNY